MLRKIVLLAALALTLCACSASGPQFTPSLVSQDTSVLYIYRPKGFTLAARTAAIEINSQRAAGLKNNGYIAIPLPPGKYLVTQYWDSWLGDKDELQRPITTEITTKANTATYVRLGTSSTKLPSEVKADVAISLHWEIKQVSAEQAIPEISKTSRVTLEKSFKPQQ